MRKNLSFDELSSGVIEQLKSLGYMDSTLTVYRRTFNRIKCFMESTGFSTYTTQVGEGFLNSAKVCKSTLVAYRCAVRRLSEFMDGKPYICHLLVEEEHVPEVFKSSLNDFVSACENSGNKPLTVKAKRRACILFLRYLKSKGYTEYTQLNTEIISRSLSIYTNRNDYACLRLFLHFLYDKGITKTDFSIIIPRNRRKRPIPTAYTPEEVLQIEDSIDTNGDTGKRNLAIIRLASRMGLRSGDIAKLKWSEVNFCTGYISIIQEKTGVPLTLQMPNDVIDALKIHAIADAKSRDKEYVFHQMVAPYDHISTAIVRHAVHNAIVESGVDYNNKKHGPHALRSSLASSMVNDGESYETVRHILGHSDPDVIKHYAKVDIENLRKCSISPPRPSGLFSDLLNGKGAI